jgi:type II secretory pathway pseudopilin PulG
MNFRSGPHHNIWTSEGQPRTPHTNAGNSSLRREEGYTLVALLALMTVLALFAAAAAPNIRQQNQREREVEAIFRGEQVAAAIRVYYSYHQGRSRSADPAANLPTSIDQLLEGIPVGTKKVQILRTSASRDPLSDSGEWRLIRPRSSDLSNFQRSLMLFAGNVQPATNDPQLKQAEPVMAPPVLPTLGIATASATSSGDDGSTGPFIGVASRSRADSIIYYYGIDKQTEWIFTPLFR